MSDAAINPTDPTDSPGMPAPRPQEPTSPFAEPVIVDPLQPTTKLEAWLDGVSDWVNPILVKESRQALKSSQFLVTFTLLLTCCWGWSLLGVAIRMPSIFYVPGGRFMLVGYYLILVFPLLIIIPFTAFRSLAAEREDGTYELLSISSLRPWQIVTGKLGSAALQMLIMLSVLAPCMAFTYLLRGVDILFVVSFVFYAAASCMLLSCLGLLLATATKARHWQILISVILILGLGFICFWASFGGVAAIVNNVVMPFTEPEYWYGQACLLTFVGCLIGVFLLGATARISNRSENRSTALRVALLVTHALMFGWTCRYYFQFDELAAAIPYIICNSILWIVAGAMMTGEDTLLSPRVRRGLPKTSAGRVFLTLFYPGPGTGYLFATCNVMAMVLGAFLILLDDGLDLSREQRGIFNMTIVLAAYVVIYSGLNRILMRLLSRRTLTGPIMGFLTCVVLVLLGTLIPLTVQFSLTRQLGNPGDYTLIQLPNLFWTTAEVGDNSYAAIAGMFHPLSLMVSAIAGIVFLVNLLAMPAAVGASRIATPKRVAEDDAVINPQPEQEPERQSPWD